MLAVEEGGGDGWRMEGTGGRREHTDKWRPEGTDGGRHVCTQTFGNALVVQTL